MDQSPARRILLLLDCCFSGAFTRGMRARAGGQVDVVERFTGRGRAVITASSAMEYAFELEPDAEILDARPVPSVFTSVLVQALTTGDADRGGDGWVSVDELYDYVYDEVRARTTRQTPNRWFDVEGAMVVARAPSPLPDELLQLAADPNPAVRVGAVPRLYQLAAGGGPPGVAGAARRMLAWLRDDDSRAVSGEAQRALAALPPLPTPQPRPPPQGPGDRPAPWSPPPRPEGWAPLRPGDADRIAVAWRATVIYLVCCFGGFAFVVDRRPEAGSTHGSRSCTTPPRSCSTCCSGWCCSSPAGTCPRRSRRRPGRASWIPSPRSSSTAITAGGSCWRSRPGWAGTCACR